MVCKPPSLWNFSYSSPDKVEKGMATHSTILAWKIPWMEESGRLQSMGSKKSQTRLSTHIPVQFLGWGDAL